MKDNDNHKLSDDELDTFLAGKDGINRAYQELDKTTSPRHLDDKILAQARESVAREPGARRDVFIRPYSIAATVFLCLAITFLFVNDPDVPTPADFRSPDEALRRTVPVTLEPSQEQVEEEAPEPGLQRLEADTLREGAAAAQAPVAEQEAPGIEADAAAVAEDDTGGAGANSAPAETARPDNLEDLLELVEEARLEEPAEARERSIASNAQQVSANITTYRNDRESWLREIARLRAAGETEGAGQEVDLFLESYPDADIEAELADLE